MSLIYWDTMLFVYLLEEHLEYGKRVQQIAERISERGDRVCTSVFAVGEVLTGPAKAGKPDMVNQLLEEFQNPRIELMGYTLATAKRYAEIRGAYRVTPADAIHLATAAEAGASLFLTHDRRLSKLVIPGIAFIAGLDVNLF